MNALKENLVIVIPARKNSKRLKNKNFRNFHGFPLFEWSLVAALYIKRSLYNLGLTNIEIICTSDDKRIIQIVKKLIPTINHIILYLNCIEKFYYVIQMMMGYNIGLKNIIMVYQ